MEILEKLTAKGGDILSRTIENFKTPQKSNLTNGGSDSEGEEAKTPKAEGMDIDDQGSGGRSTRGERRLQTPSEVGLAMTCQYRSPPGTTSKSALSTQRRTFQTGTAKLRSTPISSTNLSRRQSHRL